jgi:hypothetical protein
MGAGLTDRVHPFVVPEKAEDDSAMREGLLTEAFHHSKERYCIVSTTRTINSVFS